MEKESEYLKLLTSNYCKLHSYVLCLVCNRADAEDLMQEIAVVMWKNYDKFVPGSSFMAWAKTIARNKVMDHRKMKMRAQNKLNPQLLEIMYKERQVDNELIDDKIIALEKCINKLAQNDKTILNLKYFENNSIKDISARLNIPLHTTYRKVAKVHELLLGCVKRNLLAEGAK